MCHEHPVVTLNIGTLKANIHRAITEDDVHLEAEVLKTLREVVHHAANTKRTFQRLVGQFIEKVVDQDIQEADRKFLDLLCPRIVPSELHTTEDDQEEQEEGEGDQDPTKDSSIQAQFIKSILLYIWSGNRPAGKLKDSSLHGFIDRAHEFGFLKKRSVAAANVQAKYPGGHLLVSPCSQLCVEFKRIYRDGTKELAKQVTRRPPWP
jgi:hypothetical protein